MSALADTLLRVARGDKVAFQSLYAMSVGRILAITTRILRDQSAAEDAAQETYLRIWRNAGSFDPTKGTPLAWMGVIARNAALDLARTRRSFEQIDDIEIAVEPVEPPDARLGQCLNRLPPNQAKAITLMYVYGLTHSELAVSMDAPLGSVKSWATRGLHALQTCMKRYN